MITQPNCETCKWGRKHTEIQKVNWWSNAFMPVTVVMCSRFPKPEKKYPGNWCGEYKTKNAFDGEEK